MSKMLFFDIETHSADKRHDMEPREFFRLGQYAWDDGPVVLTEDYDEFMAVVDAAPYVVGHNILPSTSPHCTVTSPCAPSSGASSAGPWTP